MAYSRVSWGAAVVLMGGLFLVACRSNANGLGQVQGPAPSPPVGRQDAAAGPVGPVGGTGTVVTPSPDAGVAGRTDAVAMVADGSPPSPPTPDAAPPSQTDAAAAVVDVAAPRPPDVSAPVADTSSVVVADAAGSPPTSLGPVVRAKEIMADTVTAGIIYVKEIDVQDAQIGMLTETKKDNRWEMGGADTKINVQDLRADTIYVEKLHARRVEAREVFAEVVKIQRR
ncbi:MAG TPA: hypothetical protein VGG33_22325 [Polyangia bacterium]